MLKVISTLFHIAFQQYQRQICHLLMKKLNKKPMTQMIMLPIRKRCSSNLWKTKGKCKSSKTYDIQRIESLTLSQYYFDS